MAPELLTSEVDGDYPPWATKAADVYSFSMAVLQVRHLPVWHILWEPSAEWLTICMLALSYYQAILSSLTLSTFVQILTGKLPFVSLLREATIILQVKAGKRPERSSYLPTTFTDSMWELLVDCWDRDPENRPDMETVVRRLEDM